MLKTKKTVVLKPNGFTVRTRYLDIAAAYTSPYLGRGLETCELSHGYLCRFIYGLQLMPYGD